MNVILIINTNAWNKEGGGEGEEGRKERCKISFDILIKQQNIVIPEVLKYILAPQH